MFYIIILTWISSWKKIIKGDVTITGILKNKDLNEIDLNFYDNMDISKVHAEQYSLFHTIYQTQTLCSF